MIAARDEAEIKQRERPLPRHRRPGAEHEPDFPEAADEVDHDKRQVA
jgi:hypothetical protein